MKRTKSVLIIVGLLLFGSAARADGSWAIKNPTALRNEVMLVASFAAIRPGILLAGGESAGVWALMGGLGGFVAAGYAGYESYELGHALGERLKFGAPAQLAEGMDKAYEELVAHPTTQPTLNQVLIDTRNAATRASQ